jgi:hypothetical protein
MYWNTSDEAAIQELAAWMTAPRTPAHRHWCACGNFYTCTQRDCAVTWECPHCTQQQLDAWLTQQEVQQYGSK